MSRRLDDPTAEGLPEHKCAGHMGQLAAFVHYQPDEPAARALAELRGRHGVVPPTAVEAVAEAHALLESLGELKKVLAWLDGPAGRGRAASWPLADDFDW